MKPFNIFEELIYAWKVGLSGKTCKFRPDTNVGLKKKKVVT